jgi:hypothetical protein
MATDHPIPAMGVPHEEPALKCIPDRCRTRAFELLHGQVRPVLAVRHNPVFHSVQDPWCVKASLRLDAFVFIFVAEE